MIQIVSFGTNINVQIKNYYSLPDLIEENSFEIRAKFLKLRNNFIDDLQSGFIDALTILS